MDLAKAAGVHPNTVRLYEKTGFISPAPRTEKNYRLYSEKHLYQIKICRHIYNAGWTGKNIRCASNKIIKSIVKWDKKETLKYTEEYMELLEKEYGKAKETAEILQKWAEKTKTEHTGRYLNRKETAELIGVTPEVLRNWERNGLIKVPRESGKRIYGNYEIERLKIIYMLRQSQYSISAIFSGLRKYDEGDISGIIKALNEPELPEDLTWISAGDRWIIILESAIKGGKEIRLLLKELIDKNI